MTIMNAEQVRMAEATKRCDHACMFPRKFCQFLPTSIRGPVSHVYPPPLPPSSSFLLLLLILLLLLLRWQYSPMQTFPSSMDFSQSALFFDLSFQFVILHLLISVCTQFHHLYFGRPLSQFP